MEAPVFVNASFRRDGRGRRAPGGESSYRVPRRIGAKIDTMTVLALEAAHHLRSFTIAAPDRVGICIANRLGGWGFGEVEMVRLHETRFAPHVNVYLGTAWFPAAAQGEISIGHRFLGHSKTFAGDGTAFIETIDYALRLLRGGIVDQVLVGAVEAVISPWLLARLGGRPRVAAGFLLLGREPEPTGLRRRVTVEVGGTDGAPPPAPRPTDVYPVDVATRLIARLERAMTDGMPAEIELVDPVGARRVSLAVA